MNTEEKIKALEQEIELTGAELRELLLEIRCFLAEVNSPLRGKANVKDHRSNNDEGEGVE